MPWCGREAMRRGSLPNAANCTSLPFFRPSLPEGHDEQWRKVLERPMQQRQRSQTQSTQVAQLPLQFASIVLILIMLKQAT